MLNEANKKYYQKNKEKISERTKKNKEKFSEYYKEYYKNNKEKFSERAKNNKEKIKEVKKKWRENNPALVLQHLRSRTDPGTLDTLCIPRRHASAATYNLC